jgi:hypothetical protein
VEVFLVLGGLDVTFDPLFALDCGRGHDESGEYLGVFLFDFAHAHGAIEGGVGLEVAHYFGEFVGWAGGRVSGLADLDDAADHAVVVLVDELPLQEVERGGGTVPDLEGVVRVQPALGREDVHEVLLLRLRPLQDGQPLLVALQVPCVRVHLEYRIMGVCIIFD